ncbi:MAG: type II toxin-antitoxin system RelE/ParE family toxin [Elusimicrobiota bacterium]
MVTYRLVYADKKVERDFLKTLLPLPANERKLILEKLGSLALNPRPQQFKMLARPVLVYGYLAPCRLRVADYRILYDIDDLAKKVVILSLRRRSEKTYK